MNWQKKLSLFLHDPVHKAFYIQGHEDRAAKIAAILKQTVLEKSDYEIADRIASGLARARLPGYSWVDENNGAVNLKKYPALTHPLSGNSDLIFNLKGNENLSITEIHKQLIDLLKKDRNIESSPAETEDAKELFFYLFFALKKRLRNEKTAGIGGLWDLIPADTRMPDHSIWHHCGLTSAIGSSMEQDGSVSLAVFSISPVQSFISKARKLRDSWTASVIISYLSFTGIKYIMDELGPDHIVYPSLHDQLLVEKWLCKKYDFQNFLNEKEPIKELKELGKSIASFPNKFVFLCATTETEKILKNIEETTKEEWIRIAQIVRDLLKRESNAGDTFTELFDHQISDFWQFSWTSVKLPGLKDDQAIESILHREKWEYEYNTISKFAGKFSYGKTTARLYGTAHSIIQNLLSSVKMKPVHIRQPQNGEKCPLCGEHEVLHDFDKAGETSVHVYDEAVKQFWTKLREKFNPKDEHSSEKFTYKQIGEKERLCAICAIKRFLLLVMKDDERELLNEVFKDTESFQSTTELAAYNYIKRLDNEVHLTKEERQKLINQLHDIELQETDDELIKTLIEKKNSAVTKLTNRDKYYAVLLMDGDRMGDLINGEAIAATWNDVIHPELRKRFDDPEYFKKEPLRDDDLRTKKRLINPAVHSAISDSLNSFARFGVAPIIDKSDGRLIYAGGDDVCAVLPLDTVLSAAEEISKIYRLKFVKYTKNGAVEIPSANIDIDCEDKLGMHLGDGKNISISGAIVIAHHKEPLREVIRDAHVILATNAKNKAGRNALAIRLKKRSAAHRDFEVKWGDLNPFSKNEESKEKETLVDSFKELMNTITDNSLSSSLIHKMEQMKDAVRPLLDNRSIYDLRLIDDTTRDRIIKIYALEIEKSGVKLKGDSKKEKDEMKEILAARLAGLCICQPLYDSKGNSLENDDLWYNPEGPVIGAFLTKEVEEPK